MPPRKKQPITIIVKPPGAAPTTQQIDPGLAAMQAVVGGPIELMAGSAVGLSDAIDIWFNEEGKLEQLSANLGLTHDGQLWDVIVGTVFFAGHDAKGNATSLDPVHYDAVHAFIKASEMHDHADKFVRDHFTVRTVP